MTDYFFLGISRRDFSGVTPKPKPSFHINKGKNCIHLKRYTFRSKWHLSQGLTGVKCASERLVTVGLAPLKCHNLYLCCSYFPGLSVQQPLCHQRNLPHFRRFLRLHSAAQGRCRFARTRPSSCVRGKSPGWKSDARLLLSSIGYPFVDFARYASGLQQKKFIS